MFFLVIFVLFIGVYWVYWAVYIRRINKITASLPSPPSLPFIGSAGLFLGDTEKMFHNIMDLKKIAFEYKGAIKVWLGPKLYLAIGNPVDAQIVLENFLDKDSLYWLLRLWLGQGLFVAPVNIWKRHRKVMLSVFHNKIIEEYIDTISTQADVLVKQLDELSGKGEFDVLKYITACTIDIVFETAMGERLDVQHSPDTPYLKARQTVMTILNMRFFKIWLQPDILFKFTPYAKEQNDNIELTHKFTDEVIAKRRSEYENGTKIQNDRLGKVRPVLDMLFDKDVKFTNTELRENIDSITLAGNDTTALTIAYAVVLLGVHQDAQEKVFQEQESIFGKSKRGATKEDLQKMHYLERVIKESMRIYPAVPLIGRNIDKDVYLPGCDAHIPAGTGSVIAVFAIHQSEAAWGPTVHQFDPDRFLPERSVGRHPAAFLPFSFGARNCIGRHFGMLVMKSIISTLVRSYKIEANPIDRLKIEMLLFPIDGHKIKVIRR